MIKKHTTIAHKLHDSLTQILSYLHIQLTLLKHSIPKNNTTTQNIITDFSQTLNNTYRQLHELLTTFHLTLQQTNLPSTLKKILNTLQNQTNTKLTLDYHLPTLTLNTQIQIHLLQIIHETILNTIKHTNTNEITVNYITTPNNNHTIYIHDNKINIDKPKKPENHYNLNIIHEHTKQLNKTLTFSQPSNDNTLININFHSTKNKKNQLI